MRENEFKREMGTKAPMAKALKCNPGLRSLILAPSIMLTITNNINIGCLKKNEITEYFNS